MPKFSSPLWGEYHVGSGWDADRSGQKHQGLDLGAPEGTIVHAVADGIVIVSKGGSETAGNWIVIQHTGDEAGYYTRYLHNSQLLVLPGQTVSRGDMIAQVGNTGLSSTPHLHFDIQIAPVLRNLVKKFGVIVGRKATGNDGYNIPVEQVYGGLKKYDKKYLPPLVQQDTFNPTMATLAGEKKIVLTDRGWMDESLEKTLQSVIGKLS